MNLNSHHMDLVAAAEHAIDDVAHDPTVDYRAKAQSLEDLLELIEKLISSLDIGEQ